jgi:hypothetical protein
VGCGRVKARGRRRSIASRKKRWLEEDAETESSGSPWEAAGSGGLAVFLSSRLRILVKKKGKKDLWIFPLPFSFSIVFLFSPSSLLN